MRCRFPLLVLLPALLLAPGSAPAQEEPSGFFTAEELGLIDEALTLLNMTRADAEFDKLVIDDEWRLPLVDRALSKPLETADIAWEWSSLARGGPAALLRRAYAEIEPVMHRGREPLTAQESERLRRWAYAALVEEDSHDGLIPKPEGEPDVEEMLALAARVDLHERVQEAIALLEAMSAGEFDGPGHLPRFKDLSERGVLFAGPGDDVHDLRKDPPMILVDVGGNDRYIAPARATPDHPVTIVIDIEGNDVYGDGESLSCGAGFFGVGILWDCAGDDRYVSGHLSQGCGVFGVGLLIDENGSDVYECRDTGQGAGAWGIGMLLDRGEGNDRFHADLFGQGFAYVGGFGLLHNEKGNDVYDAGGVHLHYPLFNDRFQSLSQGFSIGMRPHASGGIALLVDDEGNDRYACDIYGQGAAYWFSYGALVDGKGNDTYNLGQYGQGGGIHLAAGCLLDLEGQDLYYNMHGVGTGGAHDFAVGILVDRKGDDYYAGSGGTMGGALTNSFALLLDAEGDDGYSPVKVSHTVGGGRAARGMGSIGLFIDMRGKDLYGVRKPNDSCWVKETYGAGIDLPDPPPAAGAPPGRPHLSAKEVESRVREAAWDGEEGAYDLDRLWDLARQWPVGEMADIVPAARKLLFEMGDPALAKALSLVPTKMSLELLAVQDTLKRFGERSVPPLVEMLASEDDRTRARAAGLLADLGAKETAAKIVPLLDGEKTRLTALDALSRLGARDARRAVARQLTTTKERERVAALRCLEKLEASDALPQILHRLQTGEVFTVRFAAEDVLVSFKEQSRGPLEEMLRHGEDLTARRHALRALGRLASPDSLPLIVAAAEDGDWRIRFDAAGALGVYLDRGEVTDILARYHLRNRLALEEHARVLSRVKALLENEE